MSFSIYRQTKEVRYLQHTFSPVQPEPSLPLIPTATAHKDAEKPHLHRLISNNWIRVGGIYPEAVLNALFCLLDPALTVVMSWAISGRLLIIYAPAQPPSPLFSSVAEYLLQSGSPFPYSRPAAMMEVHKTWDTADNTEHWGMSTSPNTRLPSLSILTDARFFQSSFLVLSKVTAHAVRIGAFSLTHFHLWHPDEPQHNTRIAMAKREVHKYTHPDQHHPEVSAAEVQTGKTQPERDRPTLQLCAQD